LALNANSFLSADFELCYFSAILVIYTGVSRQLFPQAPHSSASTHTVENTCRRHCRASQICDFQTFDSLSLRDKTPNITCLAAILSLSSNPSRTHVWLTL